MEDQQIDPRFKHPFSGIISGASSSGKTEWLIKLVHEAKDLITPPPERILWYYGQYQPSYEDPRLKDVIFHQNLPEQWPMEQESFAERKRTLMILDDLMSESDKKILQIFVHGSHHWNLSCFLVLQNAFYKGRNTRTISLNAGYMVILKNPRDASQIMHLARQMFPSNPQFLVESYRDATRRPFGYILIDLKGDTPEHARVRTNVFYEGGTQYVYVPK